MAKGDKDRILQKDDVVVNPKTNQINVVTGASGGQYTTKTPQNTHGGAPAKVDPRKVK